MKRILVVSWRNHGNSSDGKGVNDQQNTHEEADTKIILHCPYASHHDTTTLHNFPPDIDVFAFSLSWSTLFPSDTMFLTGLELRKRMIDLNYVWYTCLSSEKVRALLGLMALSGRNVTAYLDEKENLLSGKSSEREILDTEGNKNRTEE